MKTKLIKKVMVQYEITISDVIIQKSTGDVYKRQTHNYSYISVYHFYDMICMVAL